MENNEITRYEQAPIEIKTNRNNYLVSLNGQQFELKRNVDFGKVKQAKTPTLWKAGAEKILNAYKLPYDVIVKDSYKDHDKGYFYYEVIARVIDKDGTVLRVGVGCANTRESSNGNASGFNVANSVLKKAKKRAIVDLALTFGSLSDMFTQDMEDENNNIAASQLMKEDDPITSKQTQRIYAIAGSNGISVEEAKQILVSLGFASTKDIKNKDYDNVCEKFRNFNKEKGGK